MTPILHGASPTPVAPKVELRAQFRHDLEVLEQAWLVVTGELREFAADSG